MKKSPPFDDKPMRYILRIDARHHAWKVSVKRSNRHLHKYFTDSEHGGTAAALAAALAYRDQLVEKTTDADYEVWKRELPRTNNTSGITGVSRSLVRAPKNTNRRDYTVWQGYYMGLDGKRRLKGFTESKYGKKGAFERAVQFHREGMERVHREALQRQGEAGVVSPKPDVRAKHPRRGSTSKVQPQNAH